MQSLPSMAAVFILLAAALVDLRAFLIPNELSFGLLALWPVCWLVGGAVPPPESAALAFAGTTLVLGLQWHVGHSVPWLRFGGGDWKLLSALAPWAGLGGLPDLLLGTALIGGVEAIALLAARGLVPVGSSVRRSAWAGPALAAGGIPYGVSIAASGILVILDALRS